jgi:hypothetical protein
MAITKLRLQQIQDEVADFAKASIPANHAADPETLHGMLQNLQKTIEMRFGADAIHADGIYKNADIGKIAEFGSGVTADASIKHLGTGKLILSGAGSMDLTADGAQTIAAASQDIDVVGAIAENAGSLTAVYGAASSISTSAGDLDLLAAGVMDVDGAGVEIDSSVAAHVKAAGGALVLSSSAQASVEGATLLLDSEGAATFDIEGALTETAASLSAVYVGAMNLEAGAASELKTTAGDLRIDAFAGLSGSGENVWLSASAAMENKAGYYSVLSASDIEMTAVNKTEALSGAWTVDAVSFDADFTAASHLIAAGAGATMEVAGASLELSASADFIRLDDAFRADASLPAYYDNGIKLADSASDWTSFEAAFGNKSILKAISEAAAGSATAARFIGVVGANGVSLGDQCMKSTDVTWTKGTASAVQASYTSASYAVGSEYTAAELDFACEVYVNGQKLVQTADFRITDGAATPGDYNGAGTMDIEFTFDLEEADVVEVIIK